MKTIGIIGAMEVEVAILKEKMEDVRTVSYTHLTLPTNSRV